MYELNVVQLGSLGANRPAAFATGPFGSAVSARYFRDAGVPMIRGSNLSEDVGVRLDSSDLVFVSEELAGQFKRSIAVPGDLVFTCWGTIGQLGLIEDDGPFEKYLVSNKQMKMTPDADRVIPLYLYYYLSQPTMVSLIKGQSIGSSVPGFNLGQLKELPVALPDLSKQRAIAEVLGAFDDKIAANNRVVVLSDKLAEAILTAALDGRSSLLVSQALVTMGSSPPGTSYNDKADGLPFYQGVRDFGIRFPQRRVWTIAPVRTANIGDTLVSVRAPVGRTNVANENMCIGRGVASLRSRSGCPMTLFHQVRAAREAWAPYEAEGTVFGAINKSQLEAVLLPTVRPGAGEHLEQTLTEIESRIAAALSENETLAATRDKLLPLLMSGKVRVRVAEKLVEEAV
jgi:type I restriction enzyme S subunit